MKTVSIILTHWGQNDLRSQLMRQCVVSLIETTKHLPVEILVFDNGSNIEDSNFLLNLAQEKKIQFYVRSSENLYFGFGRNTLSDIAIGEYLAFSDNDIIYKQGWLEWCVGVLEANPGKYMATPLRTDRQHRREQYWKGTVEYGGEKLLVNMKAGSNSWVIRREDFDEIGKFRNHQVAGTHWTDAFVNKGYLVITKENNSLAEDIGFKRGYNFKMKAIIERSFANGLRIGINS